MKYALAAIATIAAGALAGCDHPATTHSSTTVVKEPTVVEKQKETVVQSDANAAPSTAQPAAPASSSTTNVNVDANKPADTTTSEHSKSTTTSRVDTPMGTATKTETTRSTTTK